MTQQELARLSGLLHEKVKLQHQQAGMKDEPLAKRFYSIRLDGPNLGSVVHTTISPETAREVLDTLARRFASRIAQIDEELAAAGIEVADTVDETPEEVDP